MDLVIYPHPGLLRKTADVQAVDDEIRTRVDEMLEIMHESKGVGLAAPQVDWNARLFVMNPTEDPADDEVLINPVIKKRRGKVMGEEGCLSLPGIYVQVERAKEIDVEYTDRDGNRRTETRQDFPARIIQHELDHLNNILLTHRMSPAERIKFKREIESMVEGG